MNKLANISMVLVILTTIALLSTSCCSYLSVANSKDELVKQKVYKSGDETAIKAMNVNGSMALGIDIGNWEAIKKHPFRQLGCAIIDLATIYAAERGINKLSEDNNTSNEPSQNITVNITYNGTPSGDGNSPNTTDLNNIENSRVDLNNVEVNIVK